MLCRERSSSSISIICRPLQDIVFYIEAFVHESIIVYMHPPHTCKAYLITILLHVYCATYDAPPTPLWYGIHHTIAVMAIYRVKAKLQIIWAGGVVVQCCHHRAARFACCLSRFASFIVRGCLQRHPLLDPYFILLNLTSYLKRVYNINRKEKGTRHICIHTYGIHTSTTTSHTPHKYTPPFT